MDGGWTDREIEVGDDRALGDSDREMAEREHGEGGDFRDGAFASLYARMGFCKGFFVEYMFLAVSFSFTKEKVS